MKPIISFTLLVVGIVLIILGIQASDSLGSDFSRFFTGAPTDKAIWMLLIGVVAVIVGSGGISFRNKTR